MGIEEKVQIHECSAQWRSLADSHRKRVMIQAEMGIVNQEEAQNVFVAASMLDEVASRMLLRTV